MTFDELINRLETWIVDYIERDALGGDNQGILNPPSSTNKILDFIQVITYRLAPTIMNHDDMDEIDLLITPNVDDIDILSFVTRLRGWLRVTIDEPTINDYVDNLIGAVDPRRVSEGLEGFTNPCMLSDELKACKKVWWFNTVIILSNVSTPDIFKRIHALQDDEYYTSIRAAAAEEHKQRLREEALAAKTRKKTGA